MMKKYLIIGGNGFIGSHLSNELLKQGDSVVIIDSAPALPGSPVHIHYAIDIEDREKAAGVFEKEKPDVVIYLAGPIRLRKTIGDPLFLKDMDFLSRLNIVLNACKGNNVKKFIFASSGGAIYQDAATIPTPEDYPAHPGSLYGLANLAMEKYIRQYAAACKLDFTIARLANVYGPGQWESGFIPATILKLLRKERPVIHGSGDQTRDFIYIDDAVGMLITLIQKGNNEIYNVGSGREASLNEVAALLEDLMGVKVEIDYQDQSMPETERSVLDIQKIKKEIGGVAATSMDEGLRKTIEWYQNHG